MRTGFAERVPPFPPQTANCTVCGFWQLEQRAPSKKLHIRRGRLLIPNHPLTMCVAQRRRRGALPCVERLAEEQAGGSPTPCSYDSGVQGRVSPQPRVPPPRVHTPRLLVLPQARRRGLRRAGRRRGGHICEMGVPVGLCLRASRPGQGLRASRRASSLSRSSAPLEAPTILPCRQAARLGAFAVIFLDVPLSAVK